MRRESALRSGVVVAAISCLFPLQAVAASFPTRPVRLVVPFPPGGPSDIVARLTSSAAGNILDSQFVIDNRSGAGGRVGTEIVKNAAPTGYTIGIGTAGTHAIDVSVGPKLAYNPISDFSPIIALASVPYLVVVPASSPESSLAALLTRAKSAPGKLSFGTSGIGTVPQLGMELLESMSGVRLLDVPYRGTAPTVIALLRGAINVSLVGIVAALPQIRAGKLRALAATGLRRTAVLPHVPTVAESGFPGYQAETWFGLFAPRGAPRIAIHDLNRAFNKALYRPKVEKTLTSLGAERIGGTPEKFGVFVKSELKKWAAVVKSFSGGAR